MKIVTIKQWSRKALTLCLMTMLIATYSMVALAAQNKPVGELTVSGSTSADSEFVTVNGEAAKTGRTIFSSSAIATPESIGATVNFGKIGKIELAPSTTFVLTGDGDVISGDLISGSVTAISTSGGVNVRTLAGEVVKLNAGETANATSGKAARDHRDPSGTCIDDNNNGKKECGIPGWGWAAIIGGIIGGIIIAVVVSRNDDDQISPVR